ncbi:MAG TPA: GNAT family N-acetyltransferase [Bacteroidales bacterium]|jgi:ribosomal protein S18 acetylase RimI-like enzyme|nr:GNAT family N-acetyltransferase [Bacteroidales bacterium]
MKILKVSEYSDLLYESVLKLLPQLDPGAKPPSKEFFQDFLKSESIDLFIAESDDHQVAGILTLAKYPNVTGMKFWIEDVVVDGSFRGKGIGEKLTMAAIERAGELGAEELKLTSRPFRAAANNLYRKLGFVQYVTNVYKYRF